MAEYVYRCLLHLILLSCHLSLEVPRFLRYDYYDKSHGIPINQYHFYYERCLMFAGVFFSTVGGKIRLSWIGCLQWTVVNGVNGEQTCKSSYTCIRLHWEHIQIRFDVKKTKKRPLEASKLMKTSWFKETFVVYPCFRLIVLTRSVLGLEKVLKLLVVRCSWCSCMPKCLTFMTYFNRRLGTWLTYLVLMVSLKIKNSPGWSIQGDMWLHWFHPLYWENPHYFC